MSLEKKNIPKQNLAYLYFIKSKYRFREKKYKQEFDNLIKAHDYLLQSSNQQYKDDINYWLIELPKFVDKFKKVFNTVAFKPKWTMEDGVKQVIAAFKTGKIKDYQDPKYSNVKYLSQDFLEQMNYTTGWEEKLIRKSGPIDGKME